MIYDVLVSNPFSTASSLLILFSIVSLWIKQDVRIWGILAVVAIGLAVFSNRMGVVGILAVLTLGLVYLLFENSESFFIRMIACGLIIVLSVSLAIHIVPGFNNWKMFESVTLGKTGKAFDMFFNQDKAFVGLIILGFGFPLVKKKEEWFSVFRTTIQVLMIALLVISPLSYLFGYTTWDVKFTELFFIWGIGNLLVTCVGEEAFFRAFLQRNLSARLQRYTYGNVISIAVISVLFGVAHFAGGIQYIVLATLAGIAYGVSYHITQKIEAAILCHFGVNAFRFIFLSFPSLG